MALEVRFEDGHTRLFWCEELELVKEPSPGPPPGSASFKRGDESIRPEMGSESAPTEPQRPPRSMLAKRAR
jgi:hypothetical protein